MTKLYSDNDLWNAMRQKRKLLGIFYAVTAVCFLALLGLIVFYTQLPYEDPNGTWVIAVSCTVVGLYLLFVFPYMEISFKRCNAYCKMLKYISLGRKESWALPFEDIDDWKTHDGVDVNVAVFAVSNIKRDETMHRQIYIDGEKPFPAFQAGDTVKFVSQGNLLIEYEIIQNQGE